MTRDEFIRKRMERQRRIRKRRLTIFFVFFIIMMICVGVTLSLTVFFPIENITASGSQIYNSEDIIKFSGIKTGDNLFTVSKKNAEENLKTTLPYIETLEFKRTLPGTLNLKVKDAEEFACYNVNKRYYIVSSSGWVLSEKAKKPKNLTEIVMGGVECKVGAQISFSDDSCTDILDEILKALELENINVNKIDVSDKISISIKVENRFDVILGNSNNINEKIRHLSGMIKKISAEKKGKINLSMWTSTNTRGTFTESKAESIKK